jgi:hypothetical protein
MAIKINHSGLIRPPCKQNDFFRTEMYFFQLGEAEDVLGNQLGKWKLQTRFLARQGQGEKL